MYIFLKKILGFILVPLSLIFGYLFTDPFMVVKHYNSFNSPKVTLNRDFVSTETFLNKYKDKKYNSFIFGSSRTMAFRPYSWKKKLKGNVIPFLFDASSENFYGIYSKIKFIDSLQVPIDNVLIVLCRDVSFPGYKNVEGHLFVKNYKVINSSFISYHYLFLKAYLNPSFLISWYYFLITKKKESWMGSNIEERKIYINANTNEQFILDEIYNIYHLPGSNYFERKEIFYDRNCETNDTISKISSSDYQQMLDLIKIFKKHKTNFKIIISPLYEQIKFNNDDYNKLKKIFGRNLFDFSGKTFFTENKKNYFESSHYRTNVGDSILSIIY
jgi:hypothetical protein